MSGRIGAALDSRIDQSMDVLTLARVVVAMRGVCDDPLVKSSNPKLGSMWNRLNANLLAEGRDEKGSRRRLLA
jgi:hypothetical protein